MNRSPLRRIVMLLSNAYRPDPRVRREALALVQEGYRVTVIAWDRQGELPAREHDEGIEVIRVQDVVSRYGAGWRQLLHLPRFWRRAITITAQLDPAVAHCHDLDTLPAGWRLKQLLGCPLVYDAHENYPVHMSLYLPGVMLPALHVIEARLLHRVDATITASTVLADEYAAKGMGPVYQLGNYPNFETYASVDQKEGEAVRAQIGVTPEQLLVGYIGGFSRNRMLLPFIEAAGLRPEVQFHLWGDGLQREEVEAAVRRFDNAAYHGWVDAAELPAYFRALDVVYYALRLDYAGAAYNAPNTLAQAMAAGRPVIATDVGDLGRIVRATGCGILMQQADPKTIATAVDRLKNPELRADLGASGRRAAAEKYNADVNKRQLVALYRALLDE